jgi:hypothetical protein
MNLFPVAGEVDQFRAAPPPYEQTFATPLQDLPRFVATLLSPFPPDKADLCIHIVVFEPANLRQLLAKSGMILDNFVGARISSDGPEQSAALLEAALGDSVDFLFVPSPARFMLYADHDEWTTIFASNEADLAILTNALTNSGFRKISDYKRF